MVLFSAHRNLQADMQLCQQSDEVSGCENEWKTMHLALVSNAAAHHTVSRFYVRSERPGAFEGTLQNTFEEVAPTFAGQLD